MLRSALLAVAVGAATLVPASAATAEHVAVSDPARDVVVTSSDVLPMPVSPRTTDGDIISTVFRQGPSAVVIRSHFRELRRAGSHREATGRILTNEGARVTVTVTARAGRWGGVVHIRNLHGPVACRVSHRIDYAANNLRIAVPRRCLGQPRWVRVGFMFAVTASPTQTMGSCPGR